MKYINKLTNEDLNELAMRICKKNLNCDDSNIIILSETKTIKCRSASTGKIVHIHLDDFRANCSDKFVEKVATRSIIRFMFEKFGNEYIEDFKNELKDENFKNFIEKCVSNSKEFTLQIVKE